MGETARMVEFGFKWNQEDVKAAGGEDAFFKKVTDPTNGEMGKLYSGGSEKLSSTFGGIWSTFMGKMKSGFKNLGTPITNALKDPLAKINETFMNDWINNAGKIGQGLVDGFNKVLPVIKRVTTVVNSVFNIIKNGVKNSKLAETFKPLMDGALKALQFVELKLNGIRFGEQLSNSISNVINLFVDMGVSIGNAINGLFQNVNFQNMIGQFIESFKGAWSSISAVFSNPVVQDAFVSIGNTIMNVITMVLPVIESLISNLARITAPIMTVVDTLLTSLSPAFSFISEACQVAFDVIAQIIEDVSPVINDLLVALEPVFTAIGKAVLYIMQAVQRAWPLISDIIKKAGEIIAPVLELIGSLANLICEIFSVLWPPIVSVLEGVWSGIKPIFDMIQGALEGICNIAKTVSDALSNVISGSKEFFSDNGKDWYRPWTWNNESDGTHANGRSYIPFDGYKAVLHKGEMVLKKKDANDYRNYLDNVRYTTDNIETPSNDVNNNINNNITNINYDVSDNISDYLRGTNATQKVEQTINPQITVQITNNGVEDPETLANQVVGIITDKVNDISKNMVPVLPV